MFQVTTIMNDDISKIPTKTDNKNKADMAKDFFGR